MESLKKGVTVKLTLSDYYGSLPSAIAPKSELVKKITVRCGVTAQATHRWLKKGSMPSSQKHCDTIAEIVGIPVETLFPLYDKHFRQK